jgi:D-alanyl-D-alanine-carboxypeptidase/D-alanyl-D-alanine-endopeptidase
MCWSPRPAVSILACALLAATPSAAQQKPSGTRAAWTVPGDDEIRRLLAERVKLGGVGIVVGVIEPTGHRVVSHGTSGAADERPLDGETVFQIGSVTKVFTGLLLADMVVRGEVSLDDPASKYVPAGVRMPQRGRPITLIDLSKHWSGLPSMPTNFSLDAEPNPYEAYSEEQLYEFLSGYELPREPGTQAYSNLGVSLLGRLLARRAGMDYEALLKRRVLEPLGLRSTSISLDADQVRRLAPGHDRFGQPVETWNLLAMPASGSLRSTVNDLLTFVAFNLAPDSPLHAAMLLQRTPGRALGWGRSTLGGESVYGHEGGKEGYRSAVVFNPRTKTGVVVLMNARTELSPMDLARHLLLEESPLPPVTPAAPKPTIVTLDPMALNTYAGRYRIRPDMELRVAPREDHLLVDTVGEGIATFFPSGRDEFFSNTNDVAIVFNRGGGGRITGLVLQADGTQQRAVRVGPLKR